MTEKDSGIGFTVGLLLGAAVGAAIGFLYAPKPGWETREMLKHKAEEARERAQEVGEKARETAAEARQKVDRRLHHEKEESGETG